MALDISRIFGGYTRTCRLVFEQAKARREGNLGALREFRTYECHPLNLSSIFWSKRDLITPEQSDVLRETFSGFTCSLRDFVQSNFDEMMKSRSYDLLTSTEGHKDPFCSAVEEFLNDQLRNFRLIVLERTGLLPSDFPPYILEPNTSEACNVIFPPELEVNPPTPIVLSRLQILGALSYSSFAYFKDLILYTVCSSLRTSIGNHIEQLAKSGNPVDLFNAELFTHNRISPFRESFREPAGLRIKIDKKCPIVKTEEKGKSILIPDTCRIDETIWVVKIDDVDPLYRQRIKDSDPMNQCEYVAVCIRTINEPEEGFPGFLLIPQEGAAHISTDRSHAASRFSKPFLVHALGASLSVDKNRIKFFNIYDERYQNYRLEQALNNCQRNVRSDPRDIPEAQRSFYRAKRALEEIRRNKFRIYNDKSLERIHDLESVISDTAEIAGVINDFTSATPLILGSEVISNPSAKTQIAPCLWLEVISKPGAEDFRFMLVNAKDEKQYSCHNFLFIYGGKVFTSQNKEGIEINCYNPVVSANILVIKRGNEVYVLKVEIPKALKIKKIIQDSRGESSKSITPKIIAEVWKSEE